MFTADDVAAAASVARAYIESNKKLPDNVTVCSKQITTPSFLEVSVSALIEINTGSNDPIQSKDFNPPTGPQDDTKQGKVPKAECLDMAGRVRNYMDTNGRAPNYASNTSIGAHMGYTNLV